MFIRGYIFVLKRDVLAYINYQELSAEVRSIEERGVNVIELTNREKLQISGVLNVASFDEEEIFLETNLGLLKIKGEGLHITNLNLDGGSLEVDGFVHVLEFMEDKGAKLRSKGKNIISKLIR